MNKNTTNNKQKNAYDENVYDDDNIPEADLPKNNASNRTNYNVEPLPESFRPRKDGPGGDSGK